MKNTVAWILVILLGFSAATWFVFRSREQAETRTNYQIKIENEALSLEKKKSRILQEMEDVKDLYSERVSGNAFLQMICIEPRKEVYTEIYPVLTEHEMRAILVLSADALPGDKGCMTKNQMNRLVNAGWELALAYDASYGSVKEWHQAISDRLDELKITAPENVYFPDSDFKKGMVKEFASVGIDRFFHHGDSFSFYEPVTKKQPYWNINAIPWNMKGVKKELQTTIENGGDLLFTIGFSDEREIYRETQFPSMLRAIKEYEKNGDLILATFDEIEERRKEASAQYSKWQKEMLRETNRLEEELASVKQELREVYRSEA